MKGCRSPNSKGFGYWDEAFIIVINPELEGAPLIATSVLFSNGINKLYSSELKTSLAKHKELINAGWKPMCIEDLKATSGIEGHCYDYVESKKKRCILGTAAIGLIGLVGIASLVASFWCRPTKTRTKKGLGHGVCRIGK